MSPPRELHRPPVWALSLPRRPCSTPWTSHRRLRNCRMPVARSMASSALSTMISHTRSPNPPRRSQESPAAAVTLSDIRGVVASSFTCCGDRLCFPSPRGCGSRGTPVRAHHDVPSTGGGSIFRLAYAVGALSVARVVVSRSLAPVVVTSAVGISVRLANRRFFRYCERATCLSTLHPDPSSLLFPTSLSGRE